MVPLGCSREWQQQSSVACPDGCARTYTVFVRRVCVRLFRALATGCLEAVAAVFAAQKHTVLVAWPL